ncbi:MAG: hypothetical protein WBW82_08595 [Candidatus Sulfotelmatobacter sp.]
MTRIAHVNQQVQIELPGIGKVKVDDTMVPLILLLNARGFPTRWSSQGIKNGILRDDETDEEICKVSDSPGYVTFKDNATLQRLIALFPELPGVLFLDPDGCLEENEGRDTIRWSSDDFGEAEAAIRAALSSSG